MVWRFWWRLLCNAHIDMYTYMMYARLSVRMRERKWMNSKKKDERKQTNQARKYIIYFTLSDAPMHTHTNTNTHTHTCIYQNATITDWSSSSSNSTMLAGTLQHIDAPPILLSLSFTRLIFSAFFETLSFARLLTSFVRFAFSLSLFLPLYPISTFPSFVPLSIRYANKVYLYVRVFAFDAIVTWSLLLLPIFLVIRIG